MQNLINPTKSLIIFRLNISNSRNETWKQEEIETAKEIHSRRKCSKFEKRKVIKTSSLAKVVI